ncbi:MAG TPA: proton-conducting transporter membrane subunit [Gemmataceae bacterium]|jgi:NADH-quinone oxidoreductase subunit L|nr:proton-conducting transporter membrane subunit [Gemmataceae bacterium]
MTDIERLIAILGVVVVAAPAALVAGLGVPALAGRKLSEPTTVRATRTAILVGLLACLAVLALVPFNGGRPAVVDLGDWVALRPAGAGHDHYHFAVEFEFDALSVPLALLSYLLCGTIAGFATRYLHREPGFNRFFILFALFLLGMVTASLADTIETLFVGWELVGLSSVLLVAFFQERPAPPRNGLRVWVVYRVSDAALLLAAVVLHDMAGAGDFDRLFGVGGAAWPHRQTALTEAQATGLGLLLLVAVAGKSALVPFSGWLPRAMEGPTPSSAVFYGALSVHLGAFLLLRMNPLIAASVWLAVAIVTLGLVTAVYAYLAGSVQTDIKSALSFASLAQVGLIVAEIGAGHWLPVLYYVALAHLIGHACLRTLQFVRAPTLLQDYRVLENAIGDRLPRPPGLLRFAPPPARLWLYRFALERGYLDAILTDYVARPFVALFRWAGRVERRWAAFLNGEGGR